LSGTDDRISIGSWITIPHPAIAEIMARAGFDWLVVDMEHSSIGISMAEEMVRVIHLCGLPALVRVGENNANLIKRVMDCGASGVIVPMVNTQHDAVRAVQAVKYPPRGTRGVGLARAQGYGAFFEEYCKWVADESTVIVQIEHIQAVNNMDSILSVEGVDGFIIGPYDLSASLGISGQFDHPLMTDALKKIDDVVKKTVKCKGFHVVQPDVDIAFAKMEEGYSFIAFGVDFLFLGNSCQNGLSMLKKKKRALIEK
jgi:2-dehydro-3-deoxyglucarate aldolase